MIGPGCGLFQALQVAESGSLRFFGCQVRPDLGYSDRDLSRAWELWLVSADLPLLRADAGMYRACGGGGIDTSRLCRLGLGTLSDGGGGLNRFRPGSIECCLSIICFHSSSGSSF